MKTILAYGDSNLRGFIPGTTDPKTGLSARYPHNQRWTGILQHNLGSQYCVIEEGLNGRTTSLDEIDPGRPYKNGLTHFPICLESHFPIDLVIFMLGSNDCKTQFNLTAPAIAEGMRKLIRLTKQSDMGPAGKSPHVLLIASPPLLKNVTRHFPSFGEKSIDTSKHLSSAYQRLAKEEHCQFLDAAAFIQCSEIDGVHFDLESVKLLGNSLSEKVAGL